MSRQTALHNANEECDYCHTPIREGDEVHWLIFAKYSNLPMPDIPHKLRGTKQVPISLACDKCWNNPDVEIAYRVW